MSWKDLFMSCPAKDCSNTDASFWSHRSCGSRIQINELAELRCSFHRNSSNIFGWSFGCSKHSDHSGKLDYKEPDRIKLLAVLAISLKDKGSELDDEWVIMLVMNLRKKN
ncbi:hypothetical protein SteCoe_36483 [Stentor coeruleus]|uniref:Uncharacterized protein n=1 Tax=Stentor coeruleus TaxID=5963 RepID=A0A1R2AQ20_9CILI|nr:hypothetical protein SteCoe_36483 [Stentor coeruleus]